MLLDKKEPNQNCEHSLKRSWMKLVLGLNIPLENPSDILHRRWGSKVSSLPYFQKGTSCEYELSCGGTRNACTMTGIISVICCDMGGFFSWFVGLWGCWFHCGSGHMCKELMREACEDCGSIDSQTNHLVYQIWYITFSPL